MSKKIENEIEAWANSKKPVDKQSKPAATENDKSPKDSTKLSNDIIDAWASGKKQSSTTIKKN